MFKWRCPIIAVQVFVSKSDIFFQLYGVFKTFIFWIREQIVFGIARFLVFILFCEAEYFCFYFAKKKLVFFKFLSLLGAISFISDRISFKILTIYFVLSEICRKTVSKWRLTDGHLLREYRKTFRFVTFYLFGLYLKWTAFYVGFVGNTNKNCVLLKKKNTKIKSSPLSDSTGVRGSYSVFSFFQN